MFPFVNWACETQINQPSKKIWHDVMVNFTDYVSWKEKGVCSESTKIPSKLWKSNFVKLQAVLMIDMHMVFFSPHFLIVNCKKKNYPERVIVFIWSRKLLNYSQAIRLCFQENEIDQCRSWVTFFLHPLWMNRERGCMTGSPSADRLLWPIPDLESVMSANKFPQMGVRQGLNDSWRT